MASGHLFVLLQALAAAVGTWGLLRSTRLRALSDDPRLRRLAWFFGLMAAAGALQALALAFVAGANGAGGGASDPASGRALRLAWLALAAHGTSLAAFAVALRAFQPPWHQAKPAGAGGPPGPQGPADPPAPPSPPAAAWILVATRAATGLEAAAALYLAVGGFVNHRRVRRAGSLRVAAGFFLLALGLVARWLLPLGVVAVRLVAETSAVAGLVLLASQVPRRP